MPGRKITTVAKTVRCQNGWADLRLRELKHQYSSMSRSQGSRTDWP